MAAAAETDFADGTASADLDVTWIHGSEAAKYNADPDIQVHPPPPTASSPDVRTR